jgi:hypothetical protein
VIGLAARQEKHCGPDIRGSPTIVRECRSPKTGH